MKVPLFLMSPFTIFLFVIGVTFLCYLPTGNFDFINFDDNVYITNNYFVKSGLSYSNFITALSDLSTGHWHPLTWLSHMIDCELFGLDPHAHHLINAGFHAINAGLVFIIFFLLTGYIGRSLAIALLFALHPMRIESVAWISERKDVLSALFGFASMITYCLWVKGKTFRRSSLVATYLLFLCSLLAKPTFITLPLLLIIFDFWPLNRLSKGVICEKLPLALISAIFCFLVVQAQSSGQGLRSLSEVSLSSRIASSLVGYLAYFGKFFFPSGFAIFYPFQELQPGIAAGAFLSLLAISWWFFQDKKRSPYLVAGWIWFLVSLTPVIGIVPIGGQMFADRWTYLPHIGLNFALVWFIGDVCAKHGWLKLQYLILATILLLCLWITQANLPFWRNSITLFTHTLDVSPNNFMAHTNLGTALDGKGELENAGTHFEEAARLNPAYPEALNNLGTFRARQGHLSEAQELFSKALARNPNFTQARYHLALTLSNRGDRIEAVNQWIQTLIQNPNFSASQNSLLYQLNSQSFKVCSGATPLAIASQKSLTSLKSTLQNWNPPSNLTKIKIRLEEEISCTH